MEFNETYYHYFSHGKNNYHGKISFYENHPDSIQSLSPEEKIELDIDYIICLFEVGKYHKFLECVDGVIENVIIENIYLYEGEDIFQKLIFVKSACLFNIKKYGASKQVLSELLKINPQYPFAKRFYSTLYLRYILSKVLGKK
jgi:hypothetical protein